MMEKAWQLVLRQLASADPTFTHDDVCGWSAEEFEALTAAGLISETAQATHVACDACPEAHWERVRWSEDGKQTFIPCPAAGTVNVSLERLRQWRGSPLQFAIELSKALALVGEVQSLSKNRLSFLGKRRIAGCTPYFFFAAIEPDELPSTIATVRQAYGRVAAVLLVPFFPPASMEDKKLMVIDVGKAASLQDRQMTVDVPYVEEQFRDDPGSSVLAKRASKSLRDHRLDILHRYRKNTEIPDMRSLGSHLRLDPSALYGMVRTDSSKYSESSLKAMLTQIGCPRSKWNRVTKRATP